MSKFKFILNSSGVREFLRSEEMASECREYAEGVLSACSKEGYVLEERQYPERRGYAVFAKEYPAIQDNLDNNTLLKALGGK